MNKIFFLLLFIPLFTFSQGSLVLFGGVAKVMEVGVMLPILGHLTNLKTEK
jgi:hypothetical protein